eukprot:jgi/Ulvmu1/10060/UM006_0007.1
MKIVWRSEGCGHAGAWLRTGEWHAAVRSRVARGGVCQGCACMLLLKRLMELNRWLRMTHWEGCHTHAALCAAGRPEALGGMYIMHAILAQNAGPQAGAGMGHACSPGDEHSHCMAL